MAGSFISNHINNGGNLLSFICVHCLKAGFLSETLWRFIVNIDRIRLLVKSDFKRGEKWLRDTQVIALWSRYGRGIIGRSAPFTYRSHIDPSLRVFCGNFSCVIVVSSTSSARAAPVPVPLRLSGLWIRLCELLMRSGFVYSARVELFSRTSAVLVRLLQRERLLTALHPSAQLTGLLSLELALITRNDGKEEEEEEEEEGRKTWGETVWPSRDVHEI